MNQNKAQETKGVLPITFFLHIKPKDFPFFGTRKYNLVQFPETKCEQQGGI